MSKNNGTYLTETELAKLESEASQPAIYNKNMKGIILAGGTATRLFPLTLTTSKQLLPVYDRQMIFYPLNTLIKAGIKEILIIVSPEHSGQFMNLLGPIFEKLGVHIEFMVQTVPGGLAEAFVLGKEFIGDDDITMILGDNIFEDDLSDAIKNFEGGGLIFAKKVSDPERFGVVEFDANNKVIGIEEKPEYPKSNYAVVGVYVFESSVTRVAESLVPSLRGELEIVDIQLEYLGLNELKVKKLDGGWFDAGTVDSLLEASKFAREGKLQKNFDKELEDAIDNYNEQIKKISKNKLTI